VQYHVACCLHYKHSRHLTPIFFFAVFTYPVFKTMAISTCLTTAFLLKILVLVFLTNGAFAQQVNINAQNNNSKRTFDYWTPERIAKAIPRDLVIDPVTGEGYVSTGNHNRLRKLQTTVTDGAWEVEGGVKAASGRILFTMSGVTYYCSGTVAVDETSGRSIIITAAHCVYDEVNKVFSSNALFIPNQDGSSSTSDVDCSNDPIGCWSVGYGVVDKEWTLRTFPNNRAWDYGYYVVDDTGAHQGSALMPEALDAAVGTPIPIDFLWVGSNLYTHAIGYSFNQDPDLRYCAENVNQDQGPTNWWLGSCAMSPGSSGGPWMEPIDAAGMGSIVSVVSWGYRGGRRGVAGPLLQGNSAACVFYWAKVAEEADVVARGVIVNYEPCEIYTPPPLPPPPSCTTFGTSCTESGQCCSNTCTGRSGRKFCK
jgi:hypothetical protein